MLASIPSTEGERKMFQKGVESLFPLGFLNVANDSEWVASSFAQPKTKSNWVRFLSDLRNLDKT